MEQKIILLNNKQIRANRRELKRIYRTYKDLLKTSYQARLLNIVHDETLKKHLSFYIPAPLQDNMDFDDDLVLDIPGLYENVYISPDKGPFKISDDLAVYGIDSTYTLIDPVLFNKGFIFRSTVDFQNCSFVWLEAVIKNKTRLIAYHDLSDKLTDLTDLLEICRNNNWQLKNGIIFTPLKGRPEKSGFPFQVFKYPFNDDKVKPRSGAFNFLITKYGVIMLNNKPNKTNLFRKKYLLWPELGWQLPGVRDS
jgi:hypothetical protein